MVVKIERIINMEKQISTLTQQIGDHCITNDERFNNLEDINGEIKKDISIIKKDLGDLKLNHIILKTKVLFFWAIGIGILSAIVNFIINYLIKIL